MGAKEPFEITMKCILFLTESKRNHQYVTPVYCLKGDAARIFMNLPRRQPVHVTDTEKHVLLSQSL